MDTSTKPTILIIEDDQDLQDLYLQTFTLAGFEVLQALDGETGLTLAQQHPEIKVMIIDIMLPKVSGFEVIRAIRETAISHDIPIMTVSALLEDEDRQKGLEAGANTFLTKGELPLREIVTMAQRYAGI